MPSSSQDFEGAAEVDVVLSPNVHANVCWSLTPASVKATESVVEVPSTIDAGAVTVPTTGAALDTTVCSVLLVLVPPSSSETETDTV